jgi:dTDP-4-amino-4,6-dideoxy-D-galactose acyltransferase
MKNELICEFLEWDSQFFGKRIARVKPCTLTQEVIAEINDWTHAHAIDCLYFLGDPKDRNTAKLAAENDFRLVDVKITLETEKTDRCQNGTGVPGVCLRNAVDADIDSLKALARRSHRDSRFYYDGNFTAHACDELYAVWIEKSCRGWADRVIVASEERTVRGYISCHVSRAVSGKIGLVGVCEESRGRGIGRQLVIEALAFFAEQDAKKVSVVTQGRNVRAQRLYQQCGFSPSAVELWFHRWTSGSL